MQTRLLHFIILLLLSNISLADSFSDRLKGKLEAASKKRSFSKFKQSKKVLKDAFYEEGKVIVANQFRDSLRNLESYVIGLEQKIQSEGRYTDQIDPQALAELPVGIAKTIGNLTYSIMIDQIRIFPDYGEIDVYMSFKEPKNNKRLTFAARGIRISKEGGITGDARLELIGDFPINENGETQILIKGGQLGGTNGVVSPTYVLFDCNGYKQTSIEADLIFSKELALPEDPVTGNTVDRNLTTKINTSFTDWNNMIFSVDLPAFQLKKLPGFGFSVRNAVYDMSDTQNSPLAVFPSEYLADFTAVEQPELWRGLYIQEVSVRLPKEFKSKGVDDRVGLIGQRMIIDQYGFTGLLTAANLIPIDKGQIGKWSFSLDALSVGLKKGNLESASIDGRIHLPITKKDSANYFVYHGLFRENGDYLFQISQTAKKLDFDVWKAKVTLKKNSFLQIKKQDSLLVTKAVLHGYMDINAPLKGEGQQAASQQGSNKNNVQLSDITFENLQLQSVKPYIQVGKFSLGSGEKKSESGKFPLTLHKVFGRLVGEEMLLGVDVSLHLTKGDDGGFGARGEIGVLGSLKDQKYEFKGVAIDAFSVDASKGPISFKGALRFFKEDPVFGNGINGQVEAEFGLKLAKKITATAIFGNVNGMRYWYVDAGVEFDPGIVAGNLNFTGFGGGAYYRMSMVSDGSESPLGATGSGLSYQPDSTAGLGVKATVMFNMFSEGILKADATFELAFRRGGGVKYLSFIGNGYMMASGIGGGNLQAMSSKMADAAMNNKSADNPSGSAFESSDAEAFSKSVFGNVTAAGAPISAHLLMKFDFENRSFHANLEAYVNVGKGLLQGTGPNGRAGKVVIHTSPNEWYVYVGRPEYENRIGIGFGFGDKRVQTTAYFVMGSKVPGSPPPRKEVSDILGGIDLDYMSQLNTVQSGAGIGFGLDFNFDTGDKSFLIFYGRFAIGMGFDAMLKDYGDTGCVGRSGKIGVNGWYANAQVYAFILGKIGIQVKLFRKKRNIDILDIGMAAILQAQLPNPFWMRGIVGGHFKVLGGLVKGRCKFEFELGEQCKLEQSGASLLDGIEVISQLTPGENENGVDVFTIPQAIFNLEVEKTFEMIDVNKKVRRFKISLNEFSVTDQDKKLKAEMEWNDEKTVAGYFTEQVLPSEKELAMKVVVGFQEDVNGRWEAVKDGEIDLVETKSLKFTTGKAPDYIPERNIANRFPVNDQLNFYTNEYLSAHVKMRQRQDYLFANKLKWKQVGRIKDKTGKITYFDFTYSSASNEITFQMPANLGKDTFYDLEIVNVPRQKLKGIDQNVDSVITNKNLGATGFDVELKTQEASSSIEELEEKIIYQIAFRTSKYGTLVEKIKSVTESEISARWPEGPNRHSLYINIIGDEGIGNEEQPGKELEMVFKADFANNPWFNQKIKDVVYKEYNSSVKLSTGDYPYYAIRFFQYPREMSLSGDAITPGLKLSGGTFAYEIPIAISADLHRMKQKAATYIVDHDGEHQNLNTLLDTYFPIIWEGNYYCRPGFKIPGKNKIHFSKQNLKFVNPIVIKDKL
ncbi:MAG: hypothetical protein AAFQ94_11920 [Bacteroidota bacterium]